MTALLETEGARELGNRLMAAEGGVHFFPIRHHSPACARHLERGFAQIAPRTILVEMPADFAPLIPLITDGATRPPVAIVAVPDSRQEMASPSYWPLSASAPEYAAIRYAAQTGARLVCCDLPSGARAMRGGDDTGPLVLTQEHAFDHSAYIKALVARSGCRDWNELWDRLFESRIGESDWQRFFADMVVYCGLARATYTPEALEADGTLARESAMRGHLDAAITGGAGPIAVVTGGFHTPPLLLRDTPLIRVGATAATRPFLVRYSQDWLDRLNGYAAGMPSPRFYELLYKAGNDAAPLQGVAEAVLLDLARRLREDKPALAPRIPALTAALRQAVDLADLRGLPGPGRAEILDAARSCFLKDEDPRFGAPILEELALDLMGQAMGDVPPGAGSPPIVEAARRKAQALRFTVNDAVRRTRELDIHRNEDHARASRFLHAMTLLETGFGRCEQGPDYALDVDLDALFEIWNYAWSPLVEASLIEKAAGYDSIDAACLAELRRQAARLEEEGQGHNAAAAARLVFMAAQIGLDEGFDTLLPVLDRLVQEDADLPRVTSALRTLFLLWRARRVLGLTGSIRLAGVLRACYRRAIDLMQLLPEASPERAPALVAALAELKEVIDGAGETDFDRALFDEAVDHLLDQDLAPALSGALGAMAVLAGRIPPERLSAIVCGALSGAAVDPADCVAPLSAMLSIAPELIRRLGGLRGEIDRALAGLEEERFMALLPHLRLAFTALNPADARAVATALAGHHGEANLDLTADLALPPHEMAANAVLSQALRQALEADGLSVWLEEAQP